MEEKSLGKKLMGIPFLLFLLLSAFAVSGTMLAAGILQKNTVETNENYLSHYVSEIEDKLENCRLMVANSEIEEELCGQLLSTEEVTALEARQTLQETWTHLVDLYPEIDGFYLFLGEKRFFFVNPQSDYVQQSQAKAYIVSWLESLGEKNPFSEGWQVIGGADESFLSCALRQDGRIFGVWIRSDKLLEQFEKYREKGDNQILFVCREEEEALRSTSGKQYLIIPDYFEQKDFGLVMLIEKQQVFSSMRRIVRIFVLLGTAALAIAMVYIALLRRAILRIEKLSSQIYEERIGRLRMKEQLLELQIRPHFFVNSLSNILSFLYVGETETAEKMIVYLANHIRYLLNSKGLVRLAEEVEHVKNYMAMETLRFGPNISWKLSIPPELEECRIPILSIQTFIENSIKYASVPDASASEKKICIFLSAFSVEVNGEKYIKLLIEDESGGIAPEVMERLRNGEPLTHDNRKHIGISNVRERIDWLYGGRASLHISDGKFHGTLVELLLPAWYDDNIPDQDGKKGKPEKKKSEKEKLNSEKGKLAGFLREKLNSEKGKLAGFLREKLNSERGKSAGFLKRAARNITGRKSILLLMTAVLAAGLTITGSGCGRKTDQTDAGYETGETAQKTAYEPKTEEKMRQDAEIQTEADPEQGTETAAETGQKTEQIILTVPLIFYTSIPEDFAKISGAFDTLVAERLGFHVELIAILSSTQEATLSLLEKEGVTFDLVNNLLPSSYTEEDRLLPLDALLESDGEGILKLLSTEELEAGRREDGIVSLPCKGDLAECACVVIRKDLLEAAGVRWEEWDAESVPAALEELDKLMKQLEAYGWDGALLAPSRTGRSFLYRFTSWLSVGDAGLVLMDYGDAPQVELLYETQEYETMVTYFYSWRQKGWLLDQGLLLDCPSSDLVKSGELAGYFCHYKPGVDTQESMKCGREMVALQLTESFMPSDRQSLFTWSISASCPYPHQAMQLLNFLYTSSEAMNLLNYGIEGENYEIDARGNAVPAEDSENVYYSSTGWQLPNQYLCLPWGEDESSIWEDTEEFNRSAHRAESLGFSADLSGYEEECAAMQEVIDRYAFGLETGNLAPQNYLPLLREELKACGSEKLLQTAQMQYEQWKKQKEAG